MSQQKPSIGRIVHYVSYGTPGGEYTSECRAAVITEVISVEPGSWEESRAGTVGLAVLNPTGMFFNRSIRYDDGDQNPPVPVDGLHRVPQPQCEGKWHTGGTWHWPERVST